VELLKKCAGIGLAGIKYDMRQEILSFLKSGNVFKRPPSQIKVAYLTLSCDTES